MRIAVTGSIATDHLMRFPGRFAEQLLADQLHSVSLSFLVDELVIRRGGVAANIAFGLGRLGLHPILVGAVGEDFGDYRSWLDRHGVDTTAVRVSEIAHTARFICTTDEDLNQIASFYPGAMSEAAEIELGPIADRFGALDIVIISPNSPDAMVRHSQECRERGYAFAADPSQQLALLDGPQIRELVDGAAYLFCNEYEKALLASKSGWSDAEILAKVGVRVTTHGKDGVVIEAPESDPIRVPVVPARATPDPTGVGDAFRAGFFAGLSWELPLERSAQVGCLLATLTLETLGPQEYTVEPSDMLKRITEAYGADAAAQIAEHLPVV
ncbi:carbohydrate kinase family protein [Candidatus Frankia alpina]|uniref:Carbohydrate kinase family protein n=1 Tax=Candidatus Frankia alpina TaxID=2699483 RepID=A0A4S5ES43_9ACTN|nr:carbohydrate kinase family protein [Candidatus Frankia alpina]THJ75063.1 carbohydrate kinase family protein [Candidatus Frankia alpina]